MHPTLPPSTEATLVALGGVEAAASISRAAAAAGTNDWPEALRHVFTVWRAKVNTRIHVRIQLRSEYAYSRAYSAPK